MKNSRDLDYGRLAFPSDKVTLGEVRQRFPTMNAVDFIESSRDGSFRSRMVDAIEGSYAGIMQAEREIARGAFDEALLGKPSALKNTPSEWKEARQDLASDYVHFGIAAGPQEAAQLIRRIEAAAKSQAKKRRSHQK
ncbi:MAG TPA: hypothetical protein VE988_13035 [Gemmataceae bacterium]|nr:hypothetical protein [Gemmataceae bacterium]